MKKILSFMIAAAFLVSACDNKKETSANDKPTVKIGVSFPLSGGLANVGEGLRDAVLLAKEDLSKENLKNNYEFIIDDDGFEPRRVASVFNKQKSLDKVDAMIGFASTPGNIVAPQTEKAKIIYFNVGASDPNVTLGKYTFVHWTMPAETVGKMLEHHHKQGYKKIALIAGNDAGVLALVKEYEKQAPEFDIEFQTTLFQPTEKDFRLLLEKTKGYNPDAYLVLVWGNNAGPFIKQYHESGINKPLTNIESLSMIDNPALTEGIIFSDTYVGKEDFLQRFKEKFPNSTETGVANVYDAVMILIKAFENAKTKEETVDELIKIKEYDGVTGKALQDKTGTFRTKAVLKKGEGGKIVVVEE